MEMTQHSMRTSSSSKLTVPFYAPPPSCKKTSAEIISEARASIIRGTPLSVTVNTSKMSATIRPINTKRPFTPREKQRTLFGSSRKTSYRPPSSFSLGYLQFQELDAGNNTTPPFNVRRLNPLPSPPRSCSSLNSNSSSLEFNAWKTAFNEEMTCDPLEHAGQIPTKTDEMLTPVKFRLPSISTATKHSKRKFRASASLDNLPEELEGDENELVTSNPDTSRKEASPIRKAYSSPVQRTRSVFNTELDRDLLTDLRVSNPQPSQVNKRLLPLEKKTPQDVENFPQYNDLPGNSSKIAWENDTKKYKLSVELRKDTASLNLTKSSVTNTTNEKIRVNQGEVDFNDGVNNSSLIQSNLKIENDFKISLTENSETSYMLAVSSTNNLLEPDLSENKILGVTNRKVKKGASHFLSSTSSQSPSSIKEHETSQFEKSDKENLMENYQWNKQRKSVDKYLTEGSSDKLSCHNSQKEIEVKFNPCKSHEDNKVGNLAIGIEKTGQEENRESVQYILKVLSGIPANEENSAEVLFLLAKLYKLLEADGTIGKPSPSGKMKSQVLKELYKFVEVSNNNLLLQIARIILARSEELSIPKWSGHYFNEGSEPSLKDRWACVTLNCPVETNYTRTNENKVGTPNRLVPLRVNGSNLSGVFKLVFKVSRSDQNDKLFLEDNILELFVESLGSASPLEDAEACVYGYGALKFLTMNNVVLTRVLRLGTLELIVLHMKMINSARSEGSRISEQTSHALFQLTGALRNVAGEEYMFPHFVSTGAVTELCRTMELFSSDLDVISNVSRTFSIISTHDDCCSAIVDYEQSFKVFVKLFEKYPGRQDVMVRLGYAIGNLMAKNDVARTKFFVEEGAIKSMLNLLTIYLERDLQMVRTAEKISSSDAGSNGSVEDVIIKIIRILANMSINPIVGSSLACSSYTSISSDCIQDNFGTDPNKSKPHGNMPRTLIATFDRTRIVTLLQSGYTQDDVTVTVHHSQSDISRVWKRFRETHNIEDRPHTGRPCVTAADQDCYVQISVQSHQSFMTGDCKKFDSILADPSDILQSDHQTAFTEETGSLHTEFGPCNHGAISWFVMRVGCTEPQHRHVQEVHTFTGGSVIFWAGMMLGHRTPLIPIRGTMTSIQYMQDIVEPIVLPYRRAVGHRFIKANDNAMQHHGHMVQQCLKNNDIVIMEWPAQSPDMRQIENNLDMLKQAIHCLSHPPENVQQLIGSVLEEWANLALEDIDNLIGSMLARVEELFLNGRRHTLLNRHGKDGTQFLEVLLTVLQRKSVAESEELVHSVLSTLNNLSYYPTCNDGAFGERQLEMAQALCSLLSTEDKACLIEATRVYGNLSRSKDARDFILESGGMGRLLCLLDGCDRELLCTTAGVLINLMADWDKRLAFKQDGGAGSLYLDADDTALMTRFTDVCFLLNKLSSCIKGQKGCAPSLSDSPPPSTVTTCRGGNPLGSSFGCPSENKFTVLTLVFLTLLLCFMKNFIAFTVHYLNRLINILSKYGEGDWQLATLVCQALWNYCSETTDLYSAFTVEEMNSLFGLLADSLDEERLFGVKEGTEVNETIASSAGYQIWEEFAGAATNLLEKMETFMDTVEPLEILSLNEERKEYESAPYGREAELSGGERTHYVTPTPITLEPPLRGPLDESSSSSRKPSTPAQWFQTISRDRAKARDSIEPNTLLKKDKKTIQL
uniref:(California timema) hypothetical protein n=1 Tax=Timema californicum TaxID=61474 RepID=A0A7R9P8P7_TIMCA|nr:unnamed protein product [Timema californicum]